MTGGPVDQWLALQEIRDKLSRMEEKLDRLDSLEKKVEGLIELKNKGWGFLVAAGLLGAGIGHTVKDIIDAMKG